MSARAKSRAHGPYPDLPPQQNAREGTSQRHRPRDLVREHGADNAMFEALAHPTRREILLVLKFRGGAMTAGQIADRFSCRWPTVTRHLRKLESADLVQVRVEGRERIYRLNQRRLVRRMSAWMQWFGDSRFR